MIKGIFRVSEFARLPSYGTTRSACFDVRCCLRDKKTVTAYSPMNEKVNLEVVLGQDFSDGVVVKSWSIIIPAGYRVLVPTGMVFDIPEDLSLRLHPRSGLALKKGLALANCEGVIDEDYPGETFVALINNSQTSVLIGHKDEHTDEDGNVVEQGGERICQGEFQGYIIEEFKDLDERPAPKTERAGGFNSTGTK